MKAMETVGKTLFKRRSELKLTVTRAASLANINKHQLYAMERGDKDYTMPIFLRYIKALRLDFTLSGADVMDTITE
jgi:DNA-binding XRE family transcriptional regulator